MDRNDILKSPEYWTTNIQILLYQCAEKFMSENHMNRMQLAEHLNVSKGYVSQLLNGDYNHRLSKMVELALAFGYIPKIDFIKIEEYISPKEIVHTDTINKWSDVRYETKCKIVNIEDAKWEKPCIAEKRKETA